MDEQFLDEWQRRVKGKGNKNMKSISGKYLMSN